MKFKSVGLYVRVSTDIQVDGYSIDEQIERLEKYCEAKDWIVYEKYIDPGFSGSNINRPSMLKMLKDIREHKIDLVLVYKLDRLSRSQKDTLYLIEEEFLPNGVEFISMSESFDTSTPFGKAMIGILSVFAQLEREQIKERLAMGHIGRAKSGLWHGGSNVPIGYDFVDGQLVINEYEALQIRTIYKLFLEGKTINAISRYMHENFTNKYSSYADPSQTGVILRNNLYIGKITYKGVDYDGQHEPIIDLDTYERVQARYKEISSTWSDHYRSPFHGKHLLSGMLFCGNCGARYFVTTSRASKKDENGKQKRLGEKYAYYKCYSRDKNSTMKKTDDCKNPNYRVQVLDQVVIDEIKRLKLDPDAIETILRENGSNVPEAGESEEVKILRSKFEEVSGKIDKLMELYSIGGIPLSDIASKIKSLYEEKDKLEKQIQETGSQEEERPERLSITDTRRILEEYVDNIDQADLLTKRQLLEALIDRIEVLPEKNSIKIYWKFV